MRQRLNRIRRWTFFGLALPGFLLFFAGLPAFDWFGYTFLAGPPLMALAVVIRMWAGRCGACQRPLSRMFSCGGLPWAISKRVRFCPYCAAPIDDGQPEASSNP